METRVKSLGNKLQELIQSRLLVVSMVPNFAPKLYVYAIYRVETVVKTFMFKRSQESYVGPRLKVYMFHKQPY